jgi:hypothetical protein
MSRLGFHRMPHRPNPSSTRSPPSADQLRRRRRPPPPSLGQLPQTTSWCGSCPGEPGCEDARMCARSLPQARRGPDHSPATPECTSEFSKKTKQFIFGRCHLPSLSSLNFPPPIS